MAGYKWLIFDADGTLFDFREAERLALAELADDFGVTSHSEGWDAAIARYHRINTKLWRDVEAGTARPTEVATERFRLWFSELQLDADPNIVGRFYSQRLARHAALLPGAEEVVEELASRYRLLLATNGLTAVQRPRFAASQITKHFSGVLISEELGVAKPDPAFFDAAFRAMGLPLRQEVLMIGDSLEADMQGALNYGIDCCWCNFDGGSTNMTVTYSIVDLTALRELL